jgi:hypothetical protein
MRSSARIPKEIPILLIGSDLDGRMFSEPTTTVLLSLHGAGILSRHKLSPEQELILRWTEKNKETDIRVVGHLGEQSGQHTYGVAFFDLNLNFWEIDFPPISDFEKQLGVIPLVCATCGTLEKIDDTSVDADVLFTNQSVLRSCKRCGTTTLWKPASGVATPPPVSPQTAQMTLFSAPATLLPAPNSTPPSHSIPAQTPASTPVPPSAPPAAPAPKPSFYAQSRDVSPNSPTSSSNFHAARPDPVGDLVGDPVGTSPSDPASTGQPVADAAAQPRTAVLTMSPPAPATPAAPRSNRRQHTRVKVTYAACIRHPQRGDEIVTCEDMSKGGLRFKSRQKYYEQTLIEVAVPYQPGQPAIFVPAKIVFVEELPEQQLFRCGVQYLTSTKPRDRF